MNRIELLRREMVSADRWTERLLHGIVEEDWNKTPGDMGTNVNWQLGHMLVSKYFHAVACVHENAPKLFELLPDYRYGKFYGMKSDADARWDERPDQKAMMRDFKTVTEQANTILDQFSDQLLDEAVLLDNPVAATRFDALLWTSKHQMWHNGQLALLKRVLNQ